MRRNPVPLGFLRSRASSSDASRGAHHTSPPEPYDVASGLVDVIYEPAAPPAFAGGIQALTT
jgi:hypothetical protein